VPDDVPDLYVDQFRVTLTPYGANLSFSVSEPHPVPAGPQPGRPQVILRMSQEHAKTVAMMLRKQLKAWEEENGPINLPPGLYTALGLAREDWEGQ
jgi:hypothetical protein